MADSNELEGQVHDYCSWFRCQWRRLLIQVGGAKTVSDLFYFIFCIGLMSENENKKGLFQLAQTHPVADAPCT